MVCQFLSSKLTSHAILFVIPIVSQQFQWNVMKNVILMNNIRDIPLDTKKL